MSSRRRHLKTIYLLVYNKMIVSGMRRRERDDASSPALTGSERPASGVEPCAGSASGGEEGLPTPERSAGPPGSTSVTMTA